MKKLSFLFLFISSLSFSQDVFISVKSTNLLSSSQINAFLARPTVGVYSAVDINFAQLTRNQLIINVFGDMENVNGEITEARAVNNYTWSGKDLKGQNYVFTVLNDDISGFFFKNNKMFRVITMDKQYVMYEVKQEAFKSEACHLERIIENKIKNARENDINLTSYTCKVRVLFFYTNAAQTLLGSGSMINFAQSCIDISNTCYQNSNSSVRLELAYVKNTSFTENSTDMGASLSSFTNTTDGVMDEVHQLRTQYSADVCVLLGNYGDYCGIAWLNSSFTNAFSVDHLLCAVDNLTFPHELGHNFGSHHDPYVASGSPYAYGYGYVNLAASWRTVMAYNNQCSASGVYCTRIPYFSNPNVNYLGDPTGTVNTHNNARVHNERYNTMMELQQPSNIISLTSSDAAGLYGFAIAKDKVENTSIFSITSGRKYTFNAAKSVQLKPGFSAVSGSVFKADIAPIVSCGLVTDPNVLVFESTDLNAPKLSIVNNEFKINSTKNLKSEWLDVRGEKLETSEIKDKMQVTQLRDNMYFVRLSSDNQAFIYKIRK